MARVQFDPRLVRKIMAYRMTEDVYRNAREPTEDVFEDVGRSCVRLLWATLPSKFGRKRRRGRRRSIEQLPEV